MNPTGRERRQKFIECGEFDFTLDQINTPELKAVFVKLLSALAAEGAVSETGASAAELLVIVQDKRVRVAGLGYTDDDGFPALTAKELERLGGTFASLGRSKAFKDALEAGHFSDEFTAHFDFAPKPRSELTPEQRESIEKILQPLYDKRNKGTLTPGDVYKAEPALRKSLPPRLVNELLHGVKDDGLYGDAKKIVTVTDNTEKIDTVLVRLTKKEQEWEKAQEQEGRWATFTEVSLDDADADIRVEDLSIESHGSGPILISGKNVCLRDSEFGTERGQRFIADLLALPDDERVRFMKASNRQVAWSFKSRAKDEHRDLPVVPEEHSTWRPDVAGAYALAARWKAEDIQGKIETVARRKAKADALKRVRRHVAEEQFKVRKPRKPQRRRQIPGWFEAFNKFVASWVRR